MMALRQTHTRANPGQCIISFTTKRMDNIYIEKVTSLPYQQPLPPISKLHFQPASQTLVLLHPHSLTLCSYSPNTTQLTHIFTSPVLP